MSGNFLRIPHLLEAQSFTKLQRLMLINNVQNSFEYVYSTPTKVGSTWHTTYLKEVNEQDYLKETVNRGTK